MTTLMVGTAGPALAEALSRAAWRAGEGGAYPRGAWWSAAWMAWFAYALGMLTLGAPMTAGTWMAALLLAAASPTDQRTGLIPGLLTDGGAVLVGVAQLALGHAAWVGWGLAAAAAYAGLGWAISRRRGGEVALGDADPWLLFLLVAGFGGAGWGAFVLGNLAAGVTVLWRTRRAPGAAGAATVHLAPWLALGMGASGVLMLLAPATMTLLRFGAP